MADPTTASFTVKIETNAAEQGREGAEALDAFASSIHASEEKVKELSSSLRRLKGTSDEVKGAKEQLRARIDAERNAISANNLAILKAGSSISQLDAKTKALAASDQKLEKQTTKLHDEMKKNVEDRAKKQTDGLRAAISATGGPVEGLASKLSSMGSITEGLGVVMGGATVALLAAVAAIAAVAAGVIADTVAFAKFAFETQAAERSMNLFRVAATGSTENAAHLGQQIDLLAHKIRTPREELNKLGNELGKTRLRGQVYVDTFNAIGQASAALGDDVGSKIKELVTRGQYTQRFSLGAFELEGTGLHTDDVAGELAKRMHIGIGDARAALAEGRVSLADGAAALRSAVEKSAAGVNLESLKDPAIAVAKLTDNLKALVRGVNIEPLLNDLQDLFSLFDSEATVTGSALKTMAQALGGGMVDAAHESAPVLKNFVRGAVLGALQIGIAYYKTKLSIKKSISEVFGNRSLVGQIDSMRAGMLAAKVVAGAFAGALVLVATSAAYVAAPIVMSAVAMVKLMTIGKQLGRTLRVVWADMGAGIINGLVEPLAKGAAAVLKVSEGLAGAVKKGVAGPLEIHSPSKVMQRYAEYTVDPFVDGIRNGIPQAARALDGLTAPAAPQARGGGATVNLTVNIDATREVAKELATASVIEQMRRALADVLRSQGMPVEKS